MKEGWGVSRLGDICKISTGKWDANHAEGNGKFRFYTCALNYGYCNTKSFSGECLILPGNGVNVGEVFYYEGDFDVYQRTYVLSNIRLNAKYLFYHLLSFWEDRNLNKQFGSATNFLKIGNFNEYEVSYPTGQKQQRIVSILDEAFADIDQAKENIKRNLQNAKDLFQSELNAVFSNKGEGWVDCDMDHYIKFIDYRGRTPVKTSLGIRLITAKNVKMGYLQLEPQEFIHPDNYESWMTRGIPNFGDVIFTTEAPLANVAQINSKEKLAFAQRIIVMQPDKDKIDNTFLKYLLLSAPIRNKILDKGTGATVQGIKSKWLKKIEISFPCSIENQKQIVHQLDTLSTETKKLEALYQQKLNNLEDLKKSILEKAFKGELKERELSEL